MTKKQEAIVTDTPSVEVEREETKIVKIVVSFNATQQVAEFSPHNAFVSAEIGVVDSDNRPADEIVGDYVQELRSAVHAVLAPSITEAVSNSLENIRAIIPFQNIAKVSKDFARLKSIGAFVEETDYLTEARHAKLLTYAETLGLTSADVDLALGGSLVEFVGTATQAQALLHAFVAGRGK